MGIAWCRAGPIVRCCAASPLAPALLPSPADNSSLAAESQPPAFVSSLVPPFGAFPRQPIHPTLVGWPVGQCFHLFPLVARLSALRAPHSRPLFRSFASLPPICPATRTARSGSLTCCQCPALACPSLGLGPPCCCARACYALSHRNGMAGCTRYGCRLSKNGGASHDVTCAKPAASFGGTPGYFNDRPKKKCNTLIRP